MSPHEAAAPTGTRRLSPENTRKQKFIADRLAQRERRVKARLRARSAEAARRRAIRRRRAARAKLVLILVVLIGAATMVWRILGWLDLRLEQVIG